MHDNKTLEGFAPSLGRVDPPLPNDGTICIKNIMSMDHCKTRGKLTECTTQLYATYSMTSVNYWCFRDGIFPSICLESLQACIGRTIVGGLHL